MYWWIISIAGIANYVSALPDLSWDVRTEDILHLMNKSEADYIKRVRYDTEDMPLHCRPDLCPEANTVDDWKGELTWPETPTGKRLFKRCPFAFEQKRYAYYDCLLDNTYNATWAAEAVMVDCPGPPLYELVTQLTSNKAISDFTEEDFLFGLDRIHYVITQYTDAPLSPTRAEIPQVLELVAEMLQRQIRIVDGRTLMNLMDVTDYLISPAFVSPFKMKHLVQYFTSVAELADVQEKFLGQILKSFQNKLIFVVKSLQPGSREEFIASQGFELEAEIVTGAATQQITVTMFFKLVIPSTVLKSTMLGLTSATTSSISPSGITDESDSPITNHIATSPPENTSEPKGGVEVYSTLSTPTAPAWQTVYASDFGKGFFYISTSGESHVNVIYTIPQKSETVISCASITSEKAGYHVSDALPLETWYIADDCTKLISSDNTTTCGCLLKKGYLGITYQMSLDFGETNSGSKDEPGQATLEVFLGFPYNVELHVAGHVLRALSLVCLVLTVLSHLVFSKTRRGRPTLILIHLCISLLLLLIILYIAEVTAHTKTGCQVANVLRYYLVMVSLLWNGVEAYNMYLMLIKIFGQNTRKLVTKAAVIAWGVPGLVIAIVYAADLRGFRGGYSDECVFRCFLPKRTLYYGYLLPMCLIILHNLIVFGMVIRVLVQSSKLSAKKTDGTSKRTRYWRQLSGAVAMLVLLGVPWLFSAFGAVDHDASNAMKITEAAFQIIFVVFVNMQGIFIFVFHCARNVDVRREWKSAVSSASTRLSTASFAATPSTTQNGKPSKSKENTKETNVDTQAMSVKK